MKLMMDTLQLCTISISVVNCIYLLHKKIKSEHTCRTKRTYRDKTFLEGGRGVAVAYVLIAKQEPA